MNFATGYIGEAYIIKLITLPHNENPINLLTFVMCSTVLDNWRIIFFFGACITKWHMNRLSSCSIHNHIHVLIYMKITIQYNKDADYSIISAKHIFWMFHSSYYNKILCVYCKIFKRSFRSVATVNYSFCFQF